MTKSGNRLGSLVNKICCKQNVVVKDYLSGDIFIKGTADEVHNFLDYHMEVRVAYVYIVDIDFSLQAIVISILLDD